MACGKSSARNRRCRDCSAVGVVGVWGALFLEVRRMSSNCFASSTLFSPFREATATAVLCFVRLSRQADLHRGHNEYQKRLSRMSHGFIHKLSGMIFSFGGRPIGRGARRACCRRECGLRRRVSLSIRRRRFQRRAFCGRDTCARFPVGARVVRRRGRREN